MTHATTLRSRTAELLLLLGIAVATAGYLHFSFGIYPGADFNSDDAAALLFAHEILSQGRLLPDWYSSTGLSWPVLPPLNALLPILLAFGRDWMTAYRLAVLSDQALFFALIWWLLGRGGFCRVSRLFLICAFIATPSWQFAQQTTLIAGKSWLYAYLLIGVLLLTRVLDAPAPWREPAVRWMTVALTLVFVDPANIGMIALPMGCAAAAEWWCAGTPLRCETMRPFRRALFATLFSIAFGVLGYALLRPWLHYNPVSPHLLGLHQIVQNIDLHITGLLALGGATPTLAAPMPPLRMLADPLKLFLLLTALVAPPFACLLLRRIDDRFVRLLAAAAAASLAIKVGGCLLTSVPAGPSLSSRYFIPEMMLGLTLAVRLFERSARSARLRSWGLVASATVLVASSPYWGTGGTQQGRIARLADALAARDLHLGYAAFWNALAVTAISNDNVKIRPVGLADGVVPMHWLSSPHWYEGDPRARISFLLLGPGKASINLDPFFALAGDPVREVDFDGYRALVYPFDLAWRLGWGVSVDTPLLPADMRAAIAPVGAITRTANDLILHWRIRNDGSRTLASNGAYPVRLGLHLLDSNGRMIANDLLHQPIVALRPGRSAEIETRLPLDRLSRGRALQADLVQEAVSWFAPHGSAVAEVAIPQGPPE